MNANEIRLSDAQQRVVDFNEGALLVVAGPGSGKTRVLTERVRRLLTQTKGHFRVLALTFTNKAANEMADRLKDLPNLERRAFIGTTHSFCLAMLSERGQSVGVTSTPQIFELMQDRKQVLLEAAMSDPEMTHWLMQAGDTKERNRRLEDWLRRISQVKTHPISMPIVDDDGFARIIDSYDAGLRASSAYDFDDLLLLGYRLLTESPRIADFYRRLYSYICIDEAQDLNEAQYALLQALCGPTFRNVMMVGDPKQSIYGFNTSSPEYMERFRSDFEATRIELTENFRSSQVVVRIARSLEANYYLEGQLPIMGEAKLLIGEDEAHEAKCIADQLEALFAEGHRDVEGKITPARCAILGRTRYALLAIEKELKDRGIVFYKRLSSLHENESELVEDFHLALRLLANPNDRLHLAALAKRWKRLDAKLQGPVSSAPDIPALLKTLSNGDEGHKAVIAALTAISVSPVRANLMPAIRALRAYADKQPEEDRRAIYDDSKVLELEWDQYLRGVTGSPTIAGFLSSLALGTTQLVNTDGVALLTVHSSKGLEFEVVFIAGMAEGIFPDYRAQGKPKEAAEEKRNAFVAVTRSKRLLYFSYPRTRQMPWGDIWRSQSSSYLQAFSQYLH